MEAIPNTASYKTRREGQKGSTNVNDEMKTASMDALLANEWI